MGESSSLRKNVSFEVAVQIDYDRCVPAEFQRAPECDQIAVETEYLGTCLRVTVRRDGMLTLCANAEKEPEMPLCWLGGADLIAGRLNWVIKGFLLSPYHEPPVEGGLWT